MAIDSRMGTYWPPYTAAENGRWMRTLYRKPHSGPYVVVYPYARGDAAVGLGDVLERLVTVRDRSGARPGRCRK